KAWQLGAPGSLIYEFFDLLRRNLNKKLVTYLLTSRADCKCLTVLEAGSGPAYASSLFSSDPRVELAVAIDIDYEALFQARKRDPNLCLVVADLRNLPFKSGCIEISWNSSTIEHLDCPEDALCEMERVTKGGGSVFVGVPYVYGPLGFQRLIEDTSTGNWIGKTYSCSQLKDMMKSAELEPRHSINYFFRFFVGVLSDKKTLS
ncbi:MAG: class I SAM-dependent methyltransferase, partial [Desulfomonilaceae bacterium]